MTGAGDALRGWVPRWWRGEAGPAGRAADLLLAPAEAGFRAVAAARNEAFDRGWLAAERAAIPVVSVGNVGIGGAGKTPFAAWVAGQFRVWGERPAIVLRGYGRDELEVHRELNPEVPVFADARRAAAVGAAAEAGCTVAVVDDGFQHRALRRDLDLVLVAVDGWSDRRRLLPRGPWREPLDSLRRASFVVLTRKSADASQTERVERAIPAAAETVPVVHCHLISDRVMRLDAAPGGEAQPLATLRGTRVLAVASLADPRPLTERLRQAGIEVELAEFPDHWEFTPAQAEALARRAGDRPILMTRKEAVKLRHLLRPDSRALVLDQRVVIERGEPALVAALRAVVGR